MNDEHDESINPTGDRSDNRTPEETVGEILLAARERSGLSIEEASQETRVAVKNLEYLETDNFEALPAKVYVRGFIRSYASFLKLDVEYLLSKYEVQTGQTHKTKGDLWEIEADVVQESIGSSFALRRLVVVVMIAVIALLVVIVLMTRNRRVEEVDHVPLPDETVVESDSVHVQLAEQPAEEESRPAVPLEPMQLRLSANPTDSTWFELITISTVDQRPETTTFNFLLLPGRSRTFEASDAFILKRVSNAGGFTIELDGHRLRPLGRKGRPASDVEITREDIPR